MSQLAKSVPCSQCKEPIDVSDLRLFLETVGAHVRLRCTHARCGATDWYSKEELGAKGVGDSQVWSFDFLLDHTERDGERLR
ncbi:MAG TPA: hypothetical protein VEW69_01665 [Alphaproteobacteria bacterium]|nr:hypothetical protein [Alphaproteobacteria bacterium]